MYKLLFEIGGRVNGIAGLKVEHCLFLDENNTKILIPDIKTGEFYHFLKKDSLELIKNLISDKNLRKNDFLFTIGKTNNQRKRANSLSQRLIRISNRITDKDKSILPVNTDKKFKPHGVRSTKAQLIKQKQEEKSRKKIAKGLQHRGTRNVKYYA